jgi:diadenosine tetraphosphate (Ap4A) HIT family hydrolase
MNDSCTLCAIAAGRTTTPGGVIHDDGLWVVVHHPGPYTDPGELFVIARRHCESIDRLTEAEASALGPILRAGAIAIERLVHPERIYTASYNERIRHVLFYLLPRTRDLPAGHTLADVYRRSRALLRQWKIAQNPSTAARANAAERLRRENVWPRPRE